MSKVSHLPKSVPSKLLPFKIDVKGGVTGHRYEGHFVVSVPEVRDMSRIGIELAKLNDGVPFELLDSNTRAINNAIAFLKACLREGPAWFVNATEDEGEEGIDFGLATVDANVPIEVFRAADKAIKGWNDSLKGQPADGSKKSESTAANG